MRGSVQIPLIDITNERYQMIVAPEQLIGFAMVMSIGTGLWSADDVVLCAREKDVLELELGQWREA